MAYKLIDYERLKSFSEALKSKYVAKDGNKKLSTNDYTNEDKAKVDNIPENPKYTDTTYDLSSYLTAKDLKGYKKADGTTVAELKAEGRVNANNIREEWFFARYDSPNTPDKQKDWYINTMNFGNHILQVAYDGQDRNLIYFREYWTTSYGSKKWSTWKLILTGLHLEKLASKEDLETIKDTLPTKLSQFINDKTFKTESEIQSMIEKASSLKKEVVTSLPTTGKDDVIYLVKDEKGKDNNNYLEYLWLNGKYELIGSTQVDLSEYLKTVNLRNTKLRTNKMNINVFTDRSTSNHELGVILGDLELRTEQNKKNIKTKLSEMTDDSTHRLVTDTEKETWNNKLDKTKDKAEMSSNIDWTSDNTYITPYFFNNKLGERLQIVMGILQTDLKNKLNKEELVEFTQQELEEAFK